MHSSSADSVAPFAPSATPEPAGSADPAGAPDLVGSAGSSGPAGAPESAMPTVDGDDGSHPAAHHLGDEPALTGDHRHSTVHRLGRVSTTGGFDLPGEFDLPPEEPVVLIGDVPWELRDADIPRAAMPDAATPDADGPGAD